jgi:hypothetical protein
VLTITPEQMQAFAPVMRSGFEKRMVAHLRATFPRLTAGRPDDNILRFVRFGLERSAAYNVIIERDVERYLEYMVLYGPQFDTDPRYAWAAEVLSVPEARGTAKMDRIDQYDQFVLGRPPAAPQPRPSRAPRPLKDHPGL